MSVLRRWVLAGGPFTLTAEEGPMHGVRAKLYDGTVPFGQTISNVTFTPMKYNYTGPNARCFDTDGYHPILADANLTGTVAKTAGNVTITGTGTAFLSELVIGYPVRIPGGTPHFYGDVVVVKTIADNTHFDVYTAPVLTASGQTAYKDSSVFVCPVGFAGYYAGECCAGWRANTTGQREINVVYGGLEAGYNVAGSNSAADEQMFTNPPSAGEDQRTIAWGPVYFAEGDFVQNVVYQSSGGNLDLAADLPGLPFSMWRVGT